eukprot:2422233-Rhodomonas_salina.1
MSVLHTAQRGSMRVWCCRFATQFPPGMKLLLVDCKQSSCSAQRAARKRDLRRVARVVDSAQRKGWRQPR